MQQASTDDTLWQGECFVFDRRLALDRRLQPAEVRAEQVFDARRPDEAWRLQRASRLDEAVPPAPAATAC